ncbi:MAG: protein kinase [Anaerolineales bacterium]|nr:protein kinase [Anaerolineales bacterium]
MPLAPGIVINNRYRIIRLLGQGGFGAVYYAWDVNLDRGCALKENLEASGEVSRQFMREARILANLSHPNLPRVTDHFIISGQGQYLVMDYIEGDDLDLWISRAGRPDDTAKVIHWISQVCDALTYLHQQNPPIIHRDIKPANIRITPQGKAVLVDFGIAKLYNPQMRTTVGARAVTSGYSPPEQYGQGATDERSDVYAVGATLYHLLTAVAPPDSVDLMTGNAPPLKPAHQVNPAVPLHVSAAIAQAMQPKREMRFQSIRAFQSALQGEMPVVARTAQIDMRGAPPEPASLSGRVTADVPGMHSADFQNATSSRSPSAPRVVLPISTPGKATTAPAATRNLAIAAVTALGLALVGLAAAGIVIYNFIVQQQNKPSPEPTQAALEASSTHTVTPLPTDAPIQPSETPTLVLPPTNTPAIPPQVGAILAALPESQIAFVSDHAGDEKDQIYMMKIYGDQYWFSPGNGNQYILDPSNTHTAFESPTLLATDGTYDLAWWPEWCDGNTAIMYEAKDTSGEKLQSIYLKRLIDGGPPQALTWSRYSLVGVPRCAVSSGLALASGEQDLSGNQWELFQFNIYSPGEIKRVGGDGFPFSGNPSWAGDDSWAVFMHYEPDPKAFFLYKVFMSDLGQVFPFDTPKNVIEAKYPAVSPTDGRVAYACYQNNRWGLCLQNADGSDPITLFNDVGQGSGPKRPPRPSIPGITPTWSPDGRWLAYSSMKDGDWDIYLYGLEWKIEFNLTNALTGDQFQPAWSKP